MMSSGSNPIFPKFNIATSLTFRRRKADHGLDRNNSSDYSFKAGPTNFPSHFGLTTSNLIQRTFGISHTDNTKPALSKYIEDLVSSTHLPFQVVTASLILVQRLYVRLAPEVFEDRASLDPHRLFTAAYILASKQYVQAHQLSAARRAARRNPLKRGELVAAEGICYSLAYWVRRTTYSAAEILEMQRQLLVILGAAVIVYSNVEGSVVKFLDEPSKKPGLPVRRNLDVSKFINGRLIYSAFHFVGEAPPLLCGLEPDEHLQYMARKWNHPLTEISSHNRPVVSGPCCDARRIALSDWIGWEDDAVIDR